MMNKKWIPHIIAVTALAVFIALGLACATAPAGPVKVKTYEMVSMPAAGVLQGKSAVVFDLAMADKVLPKKAVGTSGALAAVGNAADLSNLNKAASAESWLQQERSALAKKQPALYGAFAARYAELNKADTVRAAFDFNGVAPVLDYFSKADAALWAKIAEACAEHEADFAVAMVGQLVHAETMNAAPISAPTEIVVEVCLFDKTGVLVSQGKVQTVNYLTRPASPITTYNLLLDDAAENMVLMLPALGGSGEKNGTKEYKQPTVTVDAGDTREAGPGETVLVVKRIDNGSGWPTNLVIDKGSDDEWSIPLAVKKEVRVVIANGEHKMEAETRRHKREE
jgi:hypothetical protein